MRASFLILVLLFVNDVNCQNLLEQTDNRSSNNYVDYLNHFEDAEKFFFSTLKDNFGKTDAENLITLFDYLTQSTSNQAFYKYKLQLNAEMFHNVHKKLESRYCEFYPYTSYDHSYSNINFTIRTKITEDKGCDTLYYKLPICENCSLLKESPLNVHLAESFKNQMISYDGILENRLKFNLTNLLPHVELIMLYRQLVQSNTKNEILGELDNPKHKRKLLTVLFWKYIAYCANYDLETRKYIYNHGQD